MNVSTCKEARAKHHCGELKLDEEGSEARNYTLAATAIRMWRHSASKEYVPSHLPTRLLRMRSLEAGWGRIEDQRMQPRTLARRCFSWQRQPVALAKSRLDWFTCIRHPLHGHNLIFLISVPTIWSVQHRTRVSTGEEITTTRISSPRECSIRCREPNYVWEL